MSHILLLVLQIVPRLCLSVFLSDAAVLPCSAKHPKVQHCNSLRMCECGSGQGVVSWLYCKGTNWAKRSCRGVEAALTLYVPSLAGRDLWLAVGRCGCSVGVARPNDSSSDTAPYSDSSSMADGMRVGRELEHVRTLRGTTKGSQHHIMPFAEVRNVTEHFTRCSFLILLPTLPFGMEVVEHCKWFSSFDSGHPSYHRKQTVTKEDITRAVVVLEDLVSLLCRCQGVTFSSEPNTHRSKAAQEITFSSPSTEMDQRCTNPWCTSLMFSLILLDSEMYVHKVLLSSFQQAAVGLNLLFQTALDVQ